MKRSVFLLVKINEVLIWFNFKIIIKSQKQLRSFFDNRFLPLCIHLHWNLLFLAISLINCLQQNSCKAMLK